VHDDYTHGATRVSSSKENAVPFDHPWSYDLRQGIPYENHHKPFEERLDCVRLAVPLLPRRATPIQFLADGPSRAGKRTFVSKSVIPHVAKDIEQFMEVHIRVTCTHGGSAGIPTALNLCCASPRVLPMFVLSMMEPPSPAYTDCVNKAYNEDSKDGTSRDISWFRWNLMGVRVTN